jgi:hypothetical protein
VGGLSLHRLTTNIGAVIDGMDLRHPLSADATEFVRQPIVIHGVVFFRDHDLRLDQFWASSRFWGLHFGGNTCWASMYAAWDAHTVHSIRPTAARFAFRMEPAIAWPN